MEAHSLRELAGHSRVFVDRFPKTRRTAARESQEKPQHKAQTETKLIANLGAVHVR